MAKEKQENELETIIEADGSIDVTVEKKKKTWFLKLQKQ